MSSCAEHQGCREQSHTATAFRRCTFSGETDTDANNLNKSTFFWKWRWQAEGNDYTMWRTVEVFVQIKDAIKKLKGTLNFQDYIGKEGDEREDKYFFCWNIKIKDGRCYKQHLHLNTKGREKKSWFILEMNSSKPKRAAKGQECNPKTWLSPKAQRERERWNHGRSQAGSSHKNIFLKLRWGKCLDTWGRPKWTSRGG